MMRPIPKAKASLSSAAKRARQHRSKKYSGSWLDQVKVDNMCLMASDEDCGFIEWTADAFGCALAFVQILNPALEGLTVVRALRKLRNITRGQLIEVLGSAIGVLACWDLGSCIGIAIANHGEALIDWLLDHRRYLYFLA